MISADQIVANEAHFQANKVSAKGLSTLAASVPVYFHVISADDSEENGNIP